MLIALSSIEPRTQHSEQDAFAAFLPEVDDNALESNDVVVNVPPPHTEYAKMARYLVHKAGKSELHRTNRLIHICVSL